MSPPDTGKASGADPRRRLFPAPPPRDFDPAGADADTLHKFGLPPRPDENAQPGLHNLWMSTFGRTLRFVARAQPRLEFTRPPAGARNSSQLPPEMKLAGHLDTSLNWSGAYLTANEGKSFTQVWGQWTVPVPRPPAGALPPISGTIDYQCSAWIGLDGQRIYLNSSLPQIGTAHTVTVPAIGGRTYENYAWTQWWYKDGTDLPDPIQGFPVEHGDTIGCVLTVRNEHSVLLNIVNKSTNPWAFAAVELEAPFVTLPNGHKLQFTITGANAEWIMERPRIPNQAGFYAFPDYGSVNFVHCHAVEALAGGATPVEQVLQSPRYVRMFEARSAPQRTAYISMPYRIDEYSFNVTHGGFEG